LGDIARKAASAFTARMGCSFGTIVSGDRSTNIDDCLLDSPRIPRLDHTAIVVSI
jgi:hypothetical protein